jgi:hypothetical protein
MRSPQVGKLPILIHVCRSVSWLAERHCCRISIQPRDYIRASFYIANKMIYPGSQNEKDIKCSSSKVRTQKSQSPQIQNFQKMVFLYHSGDSSAFFFIHRGVHVGTPQPTRQTQQCNTIRCEQIWRENRRLLGERQMDSLTELIFSRMCQVGNSQEEKAKMSN